MAECFVFAPRFSIIALWYTFAHNRELPRVFLRIAHSLMRNLLYLVFVLVFVLLMVLVLVLVMVLVLVLSSSWRFASGKSSSGPFLSHLFTARYPITSANAGTNSADHSFSVRRPCSCR